MNYFISSIKNFFNTPSEIQKYKKKYEEIEKQKNEEIKKQKDLEGEKEKLKEKINSLNNDYLKLSKENSDLIKIKKEEEIQNLELMKENLILKWCSSSVSEIPYLEKKGFLNFIKNSLEKANVFTKKEISGFAAIASYKNFKSTEAWAFYWVISHAISSAIKIIHEDFNENAISRKICLEIEKQFAWYETEFKGHAFIEINIAELYDHLNKNLSELNTGTDILFVVSGKGLVKEECAKIFWIQAKRSENKNDPFKVEYFQKNSLYGNQCAALQSVHCEAKGSIGMYINYTKELPFIAAITVDKLDAKKSHEDFSLNGSRFQELLLSKIISKTGYFDSPEAVAEYIKNISSKHKLPLKVISFQTANEKFGPKLIEILSEVYSKKIGFNGP